MENSYGIGVQNRYGAFFDEDADPFYLIKQKPASLKTSNEEKENKSKGKSSSKKVSKTDTVVKTDKSAGQGELIS